MNADHIFQICIIAVNAISGLAWFAIRREIAHVREIVTLRINHVESEMRELKEKV
jgi:hypothetical protein